jgi:hypothetical protein
MLLLLPSLAGLLIYNSMRDFPFNLLQHSGHSSLFATCQFFFSLGLGSVCPGGYADLAQGCLWEYFILLSSPCGLCHPKPSGHRHLVPAWEPSWFLFLT